jgi:hypothetical protein
MIKVCLDVAFPPGLTESSLAALRFEPAPDTGQTDRELIEWAAGEDCDAVAFVGRDMLAQPAVITAAERTGICLLVTHTDDPLQARHHLEHNQRALQREVGPGRILIVLTEHLRPADVGRGRTLDSGG